MLKPSDFAMMPEEGFDTFLGETEVTLDELDRKLAAAILSRDVDAIKKIVEELTCMTRLLRAGQKENADRIAVRDGTKATN